MSWLGKVSQWFTMRALTPNRPVIPDALLVEKDAFNSVMGADMTGMNIDEKKAHGVVVKKALTKLIFESKKYPGITLKGLDAVTEQVANFRASIIKQWLPESSSAIVAVLDTETTGLQLHDEPVSVAVLLFEVALPSGEMLREIESFYGLREPTVPMHPKAQEVHGISIQSLRGKVLDSAALARILDSADVLIAHNAKFDRRMLKTLVPGIETGVWSCSMLALRDYWNHMPSKSLDSICLSLGVNRPLPHNALSDCRALSEVLFKRSGKTARSRTYMGQLVLRPWAPQEP